jgi:hypothetical protein
MSSVKDEKTRLKEEKKIAKEKERLAKEEEKRLKKEQKQKDKETKAEDSPKSSKFRIAALKDINKSDRRRSTSLSTPTESNNNTGFLTDRNRNSGPVIKLSDEETNALFEQMLDKIGASEEVKKTSRAYNMQTKQSMIKNWQSTEASTASADEQVKTLIKKVCYCILNRFLTTFSFNQQIR